MALRIRQKETPIRTTLRHLFPALLLSVVCSRPASTETPRVPVLVELFTSEGCSSCPPADALLGRLANAQPVTGAKVIALAEHVDYWDSSGWKDPFSSASFTERQERYEHLLRRQNPYTPQMIVDGHTDVVGSDESRARAAIAAAAGAPHGTLTLRIVGDSVEIAAVLPHGTAVDLLVAIVEEKVTSHVERGENANRTLTHWAVARSLRNLGPVEGVSVTRTTRLELQGNGKNVRAVAFAQERNTGRVLASASVGL